MINEHKIDWRQKTREHCINTILNQNNVWCEETQKISVDHGDDEEEGSVQEEESPAMLERKK